MMVQPSLLLRFELTSPQALIIKVVFLGIAIPSITCICHCNESYLDSELWTFLNLLLWDDYTSQRQVKLRMNDLQCDFKSTYFRFSSDHARAPMAKVLIPLMPACGTGSPLVRLMCELDQLTVGPVCISLSLSTLLSEQQQP